MRPKKPVMFILILTAVLLAACAPAAPEVVDNGNPGAISVQVFTDTNGNGRMDSGESGRADRVAITQQISCPGTDDSKITETTTDGSGRARFNELKPGRYCVMYMGSNPITTKLTPEVDVSSDQVVEVAFGVLE